METYHYVSDQRDWDIEDIIKFSAEREEAGRIGLEALRRLAASMLLHIRNNSEDGQALALRHLLLSLYAGQNVNMEIAIGILDYDIQKDFGRVILGIYCECFNDYTIREVMIEAGDPNAEWFLSGLR